MSHQSVGRSRRKLRPLCKIQGIPVRNPPNGVLERLVQPIRQRRVEIAPGLVIDHWRREEIERAYLETIAHLPEVEVPNVESHALVLARRHSQRPVLGTLWPQFARGLLALTSKRPLYEPYHQIQATIGTQGQRGMGFDLNPLPRLTRCSIWSLSATNKRISVTGGECCLQREHFIRST